MAGPNGDGNGCISGYNCRHRAIEYQRGSRPPADYSEAEIKREYAIDKQQRSYENRIRQLKTEERQLRACGMDKEAAALRKEWRRLTIDYQIYSVEHDRAFYPYRCVIDEAEEVTYSKVAAQNGENAPPPYNAEVIDTPKYRDKFAELGSSKLISAVVRESRRCIKINDGTSNERGTFIGLRGEVLYTFSGSNSQAAFNPKNISKSPKNSLVLVHNHPHSGSFSDDDICTLIDNPQIRAMIAVGHDGTVYYLSISDGERFDNNIRAEYNALYSKYKNEDNVLQILSKKYGWGYSKQ